MNLFLSTLITFVFFSFIHPCYSKEITNMGGGRNPWHPSHIIGNAGMYYDGVTYFVFQSGGSENWLDPAIMSFSHKNNTISGPYKIGDNKLAKLNDMHGSPALTIDSGGYLHVVYGGHGFVNNGEMVHAISKRPKDPREWRYLKNIDPNTTYPNLNKINNGTIIYSYRSGGHRDSWLVSYSINQGETFGNTEEVLSSGKIRFDEKYFLKDNKLSFWKSINQSYYYDSWYASFFSGSNDSVHMLFRYHACANDFGTDYHNERRVNLYYARRDKDGHWYNISGKKLSLPISREYANRNNIIWKSEVIKGKGKLKGVVFSHLTTDISGNPYISLMSGTAQWRKELENKYIGIGNLEAGKFVFKIAPDIGVIKVLGKNALELQSDDGKYITTSQGDEWSTGIRNISLPIKRLTEIKDSQSDARFLALEKKPSKGLENVKIYLLGENGFIFKK